MATGTELKDLIQEKYGAAARRAAAGEKDASCCSGSSCCGTDQITGNLYSDGERGVLPDAAVTASLGCGNPTALIELKAGETVLDLGSGGGIDVLLSARRVGPTGKVYGLDVTDDMLALARENQRKAGVDNVEFLKGEIEQIPLPDCSIDVIISNCVINLSSDKDRVLAEAFRVLKPGGRFAVSDVVVRGEVPADIRRDAEAWIGCIAGALDEEEYRRKLTRAGFGGVELERWRVYDIADGQFASTFVRATKPAVITVVFACVHNAGRSQMAAAFFNTLTDPARARAVSAGTQPADCVNPVVVEAMCEAGIDVSAAVPQQFTEALARRASLLVTMGCGDECPAVPGLRRDDWPLDDPAGQPLDRVRNIREEIRRRVQTLVRREGLAATL